MNATSEEGASAAIDDLPEALRAPVTVWIERFVERDKEQAAEFLAATSQHPALLTLVACSEFAGKVLLREWAWFRDFVLAGNGEIPRAPEMAGAVVSAAGRDANDRKVKAQLRRYRKQNLLRILWRDIVGLAGVAETLRSLSKLADSLVRDVTRYAEECLRQVSGRLQDEQGSEPRLVVLAMGKLGGGELNFSSDIDLVFLFSGNGETEGSRRLSAQEYFTRLTRHIVALLDEVTEDGFVYRVDTRLRPFGDSGPPVLSFAALEAYLLRHGRGWERYAYVKARVIDTGTDARLVRELLSETIEPFVYRQYLDYGVFESLRDIKARISAEAQKRQVMTNLKIGPGGIREIEFIVQSLQLVRGGNDAKLRTTGLQEALVRLAQTRNFTAAGKSVLAEAYSFLRRLENFIQALRDQQVHDLPENSLDRARLALGMGYADWDQLCAELEWHRCKVGEQFAAIVFRGSEEPTDTEAAGEVADAWNSDAGEIDWAAALSSQGIPDAAEIALQLVEFQRSAAIGQIGKTGSKRLAQFIPDLLLTLKTKETPALVLKRVLSIVERVLRRSAYVALLNENPLVLERLVNLCGRSEWLTEEIGRYPILLDELLDARIYSTLVSREDMQADLHQRLDGFADSDSERQIETLGQFQRAAIFRIAVADIAGSLPIMKVSDRLTELAEIVLTKALDIAWMDLTAKHGIPRATQAGAAYRPGLGVIAYGKFGGMELSYRSDLDLVFLHDSAGTEQETDGNKPLDNSMFFARLVRRLVHFLTTRTASGALYQIDTRLRPSGRSGLLVISVEGFERYQEENAWTWEHQALLRSRPVAGSATVLREFERIRSQTLKARVRRDRLGADVADMRNRMRQQLDRSDQEIFDLKQGEGGIGDIEFIVQYLVLANAAEHPAVIHYPDNIRQLGTLAAAGCLADAEVLRMQEIYKAYRLKLHRLALDEKPAEVDYREFGDERRFVSELWKRTLERQ
ncbi:MAG: bifunctional [glutamate--ammonia ligase]-adenylyl-L-tyrosine phosphorylase/[glutamate--ammonia-ligase] adenylyltransferase [Woeseia sp.]